MAYKDDDNVNTHPKRPAGRRATVYKPPLPFASSTICSALDFDSLYASIAFAGGGSRSSMSTRLSPLKTTPAELVYTSFDTPLATAADMTAFVPSTLTFQYNAGSSIPCGGDAV